MCGLGSGATADYRLPRDDFRAQARYARQQRLRTPASLVRALAQHGERRHVVPAFQQYFAQSVLERLVDQLIEPQRAKQRVAAQACDQVVTPGENSGLSSTY